MIPLLPALLLSLLPSLSDGQEPVQERVLAGNSVGEILQALEEADGNAPELWWTLLERDERSPEVLDAMRHWLHQTIHAESRRVIDTVLNHWQVPHRAISREEFLDRSWELVEPEEALPWKVAPLSGTNAELVELLSTPEERLRMRAAFTLLCRGIHQLDATRSVMPIFERNEWIQRYAGSALGEAIGFELAGATSDARRSTLLQLLTRIYSTNRNGAMDELATLVERDDEIGQRARELLLGTHGIHSRYVEVDGRVHGFLHRDPIVDPAAQNGLLKVARWLLDDRLEGSPDVPDWDSLDLAGLCALRSAVVREEVIPCLIEILRETGKPQVLRMLCHLGVEDELVRRRYLESLRGWNAAEASKLDLLPCWKHHDDETLAAFDRVFSAAADKYELVDRLDFAGLLDSSEHDIVRRFFEEMEEKPGEYWYGLRGRGFRHVAIPSPDESKITQVNKLGLTIATLQARGEDCSEPADALAAILQGGYDLGGGGGGRDYYQSAFWHAEALGLRGPEFVEAALLVLESERPLFNHLQFAQELLQEAELTRAQEQRLAALPPMCGGPWPEGLRRIPYLRRELYRGKTMWLEDLCAATPLIARDAEYLLVFLDRGERYQRRHTLELVRDYRLDSPAIRAAVEDRTRDCDRLVRELAAAIVAERGW